MIQVILKHGTNIFFEGAGLDLTPLGFMVNMPIKQAECFRDESGRYIRFDIELKLRPYQSAECVSGQGQIHAVRRVSQLDCAVAVRFADLEQGGYHQIAQCIAESAPAAGQTVVQMLG